jgi:hypothetical protein
MRARLSRARPMPSDRAPCALADQWHATSLHDKRPLNHEGINRTNCLLNSVDVRLRFDHYVPSTAFSFPLPEGGELPPPDQKERGLRLAPDVKLTLLHQVNNFLCIQMLK